MQYGPWYQTAHNLVREKEGKQRVKHSAGAGGLNALMEEGKEHCGGND